ncbi:MAG: flavin reductase family protein [Planctomycetota bacterium]
MTRLGEIDPNELDLASRYKLLIGAVAPRPIAFVSTVSRAGHENIAPYSFFTACGSDPMTLLFCPANKADGSMKDSMRNALPRDEGGTGCFVVNTASEPYIRQVAASAEDLPPGESEFEFTGLSTEPSAKVEAPRLAEAPVSFECETTLVLRTNQDNPETPNAGNIVMGRVVYVRVADGVVNERFHTDPDKLAAIGRMGGMTYCTTRDRFDLPFGRQALDALPHNRH